MDKDRVGGIGNKVVGSAKQAAGKLTGDTALEAKGAAQKTAGTLQNAVGGAKDAVRDATAPGHDQPK